ncbi:MAG: TlpA family protein disulfide reductase [bacterium]|nr:TlpA family protein disulfide reductase [bacterium]
MAIVAILWSDPGAPPVVRGTLAPRFDLRMLGTPPGASAERLDLASFSGKVVLVNFWATWCEPCEREMPAMERLYLDLRDEEFALIAVAIDEVEGDVESFQSDYGLSFPIVLDLDQSVYQSYQTMGVPESLLLDRDGRIIERYVGPREWDAPEHVKRIRSLIAEDPQRPPRENR